MWSGDLCLTGRKGSGKTTLLMRYVRAAPGPWIVWDPNGSISRPSWAIEASPASDTTAMRAVLAKGGRVLFREGAIGRPRAGDPGTVRRHFGLFARLCRETGASLAVDEAHLVMAEGREDPDVDDLSRRGRHFGPPGPDGRPVGCSLVLATTAPQDLSKAPLHNGSAHAMFSADYSRPWLRTYGVAEEAVNRLAAALPHSYLVVRDGAALGPFIGREGLYHLLGAVSRTSGGAEAGP